MRVLVTGANGFVGKHLVEHLLTSGDMVLATDKGEHLQSKSDIPSLNHMTLDITDLASCKRVFSEYKPEVIYHLAGLAFAPTAEKEFELALKINAGGTYNVFKASEDAKIKTKILLVSSFEVYGRIDPKDLPLKESAQIRPANAYSLSKAMAEVVINRFLSSSNLSSVIARPANHIGPGQRVEFVVSSFAYQLSLVERRLSPPIIYVGNLEAKRDFTDVRDIVRGYRLAAKSGNGIYNLCSGRAIRIRDILDKLIDISGQKVEVAEDPQRMRPSEVPEIYGSSEKAGKELGWEPEHDIDATLRSIYEYWRGR